MVYWIIASILLILFIWFLISKRGLNHRNNELDAWGASVPVTAAQQEAMTQLWKALQIGRPPSNDPLQSLSADDRDYILKICSADFRPARFGNANALRFATFNTLLDKGFTEEHAAVIVGMILNEVGKKNLVV